MFGNISDSFPKPVQERLQKLNDNHDYLTYKLESIKRLVSEPIRDSLVKQALVSPTARKRVFWLRREAEHVLSVTRSVSACQSGCSACCNIGVMLSETEARVIGKEIGIRPATPPEGGYVQVRDGQDLAEWMTFSEVLSTEFFNIPCPFLSVDRACQIYDSRPMACRHQLTSSPP